MSETIEVELVSFGEEHLTERYVGWLNDPEVMRFGERREVFHTMTSCRAYAQTVSDNGDWFLAILASDSTRSRLHIGNVSVYFDSRNRNADVAIMIGDREWWGRGAGYMAFASACGRIWAETEMEKIIAGTLDVNLPMLGIMRKMGMKPDGIRHRHARWNNARVDVVHGALFRDF